ncbi:MAG: hypothetical protein M3Q59_07985, partial [Actinomycetota bacterium]|nr:hypothetical protein [Actinomycetota bacterium]
LLVMMRRRVGLEHVGRTLTAVARIALAGAVGAASAFGVWYGLDDWLGRSALAQVASLGVALVVAGLVYAGVARALGIRELNTLLLLRARRLDSTERR